MKIQCSAAAAAFAVESTLTFTFSSMRMYYRVCVYVVYYASTLSLKCCTCLFCAVLNNKAFFAFDSPQNIHKTRDGIYTLNLCMNCT